MNTNDNIHLIMIHEYSYVRAPTLKLVKYVWSLLSESV
jgi:hypothetical protein